MSEQYGFVNRIHDNNNPYTAGRIKRVNITFINMIRIAEKNPEKSLAPDISGVLEFRKYTQHVWSKVAGRPISEEEADQIIEDFGRFLRALSNEK